MITCYLRYEIDQFKVNLRRQSKTTLGLADFKLSKPDLISLPAGGLGIALGIEGRHQAHARLLDPGRPALGLRVVSCT